MMATKILTIPVNFVWSQITPDPRAYKPSAPILVPQDIVIVIEVPLDKEYVYNVSTILEHQLGNQKVPSPLLTPKGMQYCVSVLEDAMTNRAVSGAFEADPDVENTNTKWDN